MKQTLAATLIIASVYLVTGCSRDDGDSFGTYYEFMFTDNVSAVVAGDTVHVVVYEVPVTPRYLQTIPFEGTDDASLGDTVRLKLSVLYGGYSATPSPNKAVQVGHDSLRLKYDRAAVLGGLAKTSGNAKLQTSPEITYYSIQAVEIFRRPGRHVTFVSMSIR